MTSQQLILYRALAKKREAKNQRYKEKIEQVIQEYPPYTREQLIEASCGAATCKDNTITIRELWMGIGTTKYLITNNQVVELVKDSNGFYHDSCGTIYADLDNGKSQDSYDGCGVKPYDLPNWWIFRWLNNDCKPHDFMYNSQTFQAFHTRAEADSWLQNLIQLSEKGLVGYTIGKLFKKLARKFGSTRWENLDTND